MLTLILLTQEGQKIELSVQPEDTFADLKSQYPDNDGLPESLELLITNGANVPENTKILDYVTGSSQEWFSADRSTDIDDDAACSVAVETQIRECCAQGCSNSDTTTPGKPFFPLPTDHNRLSGCLIEIGRPDLYNHVLGLAEESSQKYFLCSSHYGQEASSLPPLCTADQSAVSLLKPRNERMWTETKDETVLIKVEEEPELPDVDSDVKDSVLELSDVAEDFEHPGILCRLCGEPTANPIHLYAWDEESEEFSLADKINLCLPVMITVTDPLPKQICEECRAKLNTCHELALSSLRTEDKLRHLLREKKLCVNDTTERQCPLCLEGSMRTVKKSGIYRRDDLKKNLSCSASVSKAAGPSSSEEFAASENCGDLSLSGINFHLVDDNSTSELTALHSAEAHLENSPPLPELQSSCSNRAAKINVTSLRTHEFPSESRNAAYHCVICEHTNFAHPHELELHYRRHGFPAGKFACNLCRYECEELEEAAEHVKTCRPEFWEIRCEACGATFPSHEQMNDHQCRKTSIDQHQPDEKSCAVSASKLPKRRKKQPIQYSCFFCQKQFSRKKSLKIHISTSHAEETENPPYARCYKCKSCNEAFARETDAALHVTLRHLGLVAPSDCPASQEFALEELTISRLYVCEFCERCFTTPSSLHDHREIDHGRSLEYSCVTCDRIFASHRQLASHKSGESHHRPFNVLGVGQFYVCKYCDKTFLHYSSLSSHVLQHHQEIAPYLCRPCNVNFETYREIAVHRDIAHPYQSSVHERAKRCYKCQYCQKQFSYEVALVKHIRIHTGERPFKCSICGKGFAQSSGLNTHVKIHSDVRPYACPKCPRAFKIKGDCDNHVKRHSGNRPYKCEFCSKAFMTQHVFSQHRRIHTNDRPYKCDVCGEAFRRSHVLTVHRRIHTGEKPHVCDLCPKTYRQRGDLVKHRKVQHGIATATAAKLGYVDNCSENSYDSLAKSSGKLADRKSGNSSLLLPL